VEQQPAYNALNFSLIWSSPINDTARAVAVSAFLCPSDPGSPTPVGWAGNNYRACQGSGVLWGLPPTDPADPNAGMPEPNGLFYLNSASKFSDVTDGTSHTATFSEHLRGDFSNGLVTDRSDTFRPGTNPTTADQAFNDCRAVDINSLSMQGYSNVGAPWLYGYHSTTIYFHVGPPNTRSCMYPPGRIATTANSAHSGGVNLALADGSVRFAKSTINLATWRALGTRNGNEIVGDE
jgi:prepilin-type processing-associated H-X9-DG protein